MIDNDIISRQAVLDAVRKNTFRLTFAEEQNCEGHVVWSANAVYSDAIEEALLELPSVSTEKTGQWFIDERPESNKEIICSNCEQPVFKYHKLDFDWRPKYCPNCGAKMGRKEDKITFEEVIEILQTWIATTDDRYDREERGRVCGLKEALHLIKKAGGKEK